MEMWVSSKLKYTYQAVWKSIMGKNPSSFGSLNGVAKSGLNPICVRIFYSCKQHSNGHIWIFRYLNQAIQKLKFFYTSRTTTFMRVQGQKRSFSIRKLWCKLEGRVCFLIWWEIDGIGSPIVKRKSNGIREIFSTASNLLIFSLNILSLRLPSLG